MSNLTHKTTYKYLIGFIILIAAITSSIISYKFFPKAFPIIDLKISMNRQSALEQAKKFSNKYNLGPSQYQQAIYFTSHETLQNYIELEAGKEIWKKVIEEEKFFPYNWCIRHFQEGNPNETFIQFTPTGKPYGFDEQLSENQEGAYLDSTQAMKKTEEFLKNWGINLSEYKVIESSQQKVKSGRVDHTFVYERLNEKILESHYRFSVVVSGDKVTKLHHFMNIPQSFIRKFDSIRSANNFLADSATAIIYIFYFFIGCILSIILLLRQRWLLFLPSLKWGLIISFAQEVVKICEIPLIWCSYNTAESSKAYFIQYLLNILISFIYYSVFYTLIFIAAESLTRRAFPNQIQFYQTWKFPSVNSSEVLYKTICGYIFVAFNFLFITFFYYWGSKFFGWWSPTSALIEPNILGAYAPGLSAFATALKAGFWEECLFRAVPLSLGSIIGQKFGKRKTGIIISFIFQALVFGAAHANYPSLPWYVRLVELILPSFAFGGLYLSLGLTTAIIGHVVFDAILFAIPIFISETNLIDKITAILGIFFPIIILIFNYIKNRGLSNIAATYNKEWQPSIETQKAVEKEEILISQTSYFNLFILCVLSVVCFAISISILKIKPDIEGLTINKEAAKQKAKEALSQRNVNFNDWQIYTNVTNCSSNFRSLQPDKFIWQKANNIYKKLIGQYLTPSLWQIRFAKFKGDLIEREEEYHIYLQNNGQIYRLQHILPQTASGSELEYEKAKAIAIEFIKDKYQLDTKFLEEVAAIQTKEPNRKDWTFEFIDRKINLNDGQARIYLHIAGDEVVDYLPFIHEPESWIRKEKQIAQSAQTIGLITLIINILITIAAILFGITTFKNGTFSIFYALLFSIITTIVLIINTINNWPDIQMYYETTKSLSSNIFMHLIKSAISYIKIILWMGLTAGIIYGHRKYHTYDNRLTQIISGLCLGIIFSTSLALIKNQTQNNMPILPLVSYANAFIPCLSYFISYLIFYIESTIIILFMASLTGWRISLSTILWMILMAINISNYYQFESFIVWVSSILMLSLLFIIFYKYFLRYNTSIIPFITIVPIIIKISSHILYPTFIGSIECGIISLIILIILSFLLHLSLSLKENSLKE